MSLCMISSFAGLAPGFAWVSGIDELDRVGPRDLGTAVHHGAAGKKIVDLVDDDVGDGLAVLAEDVAGQRIGDAVDRPRHPHAAAAGDVDIAAGIDEDALA